MHFFPPCILTSHPLHPYWFDHPKEYVGNLPIGYIRSATVNSSLIVLWSVTSMALVPLMHFTWECWLKVMCNGGRRNLSLSVNSTLACSTQLDHNTEKSHQRLPPEQQPAHPLISLQPSPGHEPTKRSRRYRSSCVKRLQTGWIPLPFAVTSLRREYDELVTERRSLSLRI
jgi:hypothetical protein